MKYLQDYIQDEQTLLLEKHGVFFAFSEEQFKEQKKDDVVYVSLGAGGYAPKSSALQFVNAMAALRTTGIARDKAENSKQAIIVREINNFEAFYTGETTDVLQALDGYGYTEADIRQFM